MQTKDVAVGSFYLMIGRVITLACGFLVHIIIARILGPETFGYYTLVISVLLWVEGSVAVGLPSIFRKVISENNSYLLPISRSIVRTSLPYCIGIWVVFVALSPLVAFGLGDERLIIFLIVASLDIPFFGLYSTYLGLLNGHGNFLAQSALVSIYSIARTVFIIAAVIVGLGVAGAFVGNAAGSLVGMAVAYFRTRKIASQYAETNYEPVTLKSPLIKSRIMSFGAPYLFSALLMSVLIHMDIWFVKGLSAAANLGEESVGYYGAASNLARVPYMLVTAISVSIFPAVSKAVFENRLDDSRELIRQLLRLQLILIMPAIAVVSVSAGEVVEMLYSDAYRPAGSVLRILFVGVCVFTILSYFTNIIAAQNRPYFGFWLSLAMLPLAVTALILLIPRFGIEGAAIATTLVASAGLLVAATKLWREIGSFVSIISTARISVSSLGMVAAWHGLSLHMLNLFVAYAVIGTVYALLLVVTREISVEELLAIKNRVLGSGN